MSDADNPTRGRAGGVARPGQRPQSAFCLSGGLRHSIGAGQPACPLPLPRSLPASSPPSVRLLQQAMTRWRLRRVTSFCQRRRPPLPICQWGLSSRRCTQAPLRQTGSTHPRVELRPRRRSRAKSLRPRLLLCHLLWSQRCRSSGRPGVYRE